MKHVSCENAVNEQVSMTEKNRQVMEQFIRFINTGDRSIGEPIISPEPLRGFGGYMEVLNMMRGAMSDIQWKVEKL